MPCRFAWRPSTPTACCRYAPISQVHATAYSFRRALQANLPAHLRAPSAGRSARRAARAAARSAGRGGGALARRPRVARRRWHDQLAADRSPRAARSSCAAATARPARPCKRSWRTGCPSMAAGATIPIAMRPAACRRTCTGGTSRRTKCSTRSWRERAGWATRRGRATGAREGWWGVGANAEAFLDQLITWRELGFNFTSKRDDYDLFESLPPWALATLEGHADDDREWVYDLDDLERARTHDPLWNAAQRQLASEGRMHNYLRMLWGKKILQWSATPREALAAMIELNNKYALDGRNPNSYSGIFWVLGRYDRPWFPERPIFGVVRYMTSESAARKLRLREYLKRYGIAGNRSSRDQGPVLLIRLAPVLRDQLLDLGCHPGDTRPRARPRAAASATGRRPSPDRRAAGTRRAGAWRRCCRSCPSTSARCAALQPRRPPARPHAAG